MPTVDSNNLRDHLGAEGNLRNRRTDGPREGGAHGDEPQVQPEPAEREEKQCRICLDGEDSVPELGRLIRPCLCKGSISVSFMFESLPLRR